MQVAKTFLISVNCSRSLVGKILLVLILIRLLFGDRLREGSFMLGRDTRLAAKAGNSISIAMAISMRTQHTLRWSLYVHT